MDAGGSAWHESLGAHPMFPHRSRSRHSRPHRARTIACVLLLVASACASRERTRSSGAAADGRASASGPRAPAQPAPWTDAFAKPAVLIAAEIRVEGPKGLLDHVATVSDPDEFNRTEKTRPEGFLQEIVVKPDAVGAEIRAQLDQLTIVATRRLVVLERPAAVDVTVVAQGDAYWASRDEDEKRGESLRFHGKIAR